MKLRDDVPPNWPHQDSQEQFLDTMYERSSPGALVAVEMGGGKTKPTIQFASKPEFKRVLVIAPLSVVSVWEDQLAQYWPLEQRPIVYAHRGGNGAKSVREAYKKEPRRIGAPPFWFIVNYDALARADGAVRKYVDDAHWDLIICDEGHRLKAPRGKTSLAVAAIAERAKFCVALTGTPLPQGIIDAFGLMRFIDPDIFGTKITNFRARYFRRATTWAERKQSDRQWFATGGAQVECYVPQNVAEFESKMAPVTFRVKTEDVLDLPDAVDHEIKVPLELSASKVYLNLEQEIIAEIEEGTITAANAMVKMLRLQQVTAGRRIPTDEGEVNYLSRAKQNSLKDLLDDLPANEPVVVFTRFKSDVEAVGEVANETTKKGVVIRGGMAQLTGQANELEHWQKGGARVLAVNPQAGGVGVDMTRARYAVWYSLPWGLSLYEQARARLVRPGQERSVEFIQLTAELSPRGLTIDTLLARALRAKGDIVEALLLGLVERARQAV